MIAGPTSFPADSGGEALDDTAEEPHSPPQLPVPAAAANGLSATDLLPSGDPLVLPLAFAGGAIIGLLALIVPLVTVAMDRSDQSGAVPGPPARSVGGSAGRPAP
jgi:hypothetical protein